MNSLAVAFIAAALAVAAPTFVENRPGAGGTIATAIVSKAAPDGYTNAPERGTIQARRRHQGDARGIQGPAGIPARNRRGARPVRRRGPGTFDGADQINRELARILSLPEIREKLLSYDFHVVSSTPEETDRTLRADIENFRKIGLAAGLIAK